MESPVLLVQPLSFEVRELYRIFYSDNSESVDSDSGSDECSKWDVFRMRNTGEQSGLDLLCPQDVVIKAHSYGNKIPLGIKGVLVCGDKTYPYHLDPRSSMGLTTPLRLSNSQGKIDLCYRGELCALVDNFSDTDYSIMRGQRLFQLTQPSSMPFNWRLYDGDLTKDYPTKRGEGGFGSTGK